MMTKTQFYAPCSTAWQNQVSTEPKKNSKLEREAREYDYVYAPDNFQSFVDGAEWAVDEVCIFLRDKKYQEYPGGPLERLFSDDLIDELREKVLGE